MRASLLCATMLTAVSLQPANAQRFRVPLPAASPTPTPSPSATPTPTPSRVMLRPLPVRQTAPAAAPAPTPAPSETPVFRPRPIRQTAPSPSPTPAPTLSTPFGRTPTAPIGTGTQRLPTVQVKPTGTMALNIIDRGYAEADANGARTLTIAACVADEYGNPGSISTMRYDIDLPGGHRTGEMELYIQKGQKPGPNSPTGKKAEIIGNCRKAAIAFKPCEVAPKEYPLSIMAEFADRAPMSVKDQTILAEYPSSITLSPASFESGLPQQVSGMVSAPCNAAGGATVTLSSHNGPPVTLTTAANGAFSGSYVFTKPGKASLDASAMSDQILSSETSLSVSPAAPAVTALVVNQPKLAKLSSPTTFAVRVRHAKSQIAMAGANVTLSYAGTSCKAVSAGDGTATCAVTLGADKANLVNTSQVLSVAVADTASVAVEGLGKTTLADKQGLVSFTFGGLIAMPIIQGSKPAGVLLQSFNPKWSGTGAHLDNGALLYPAADFSKSQPFNIPTFNKAGFSYYIDGVLVRTGTLALEAPARIRIPLSITSSLQGRGPRMKGFCFRLYCRIVGYDNSTPDINNIALKEGYASIDLFVESGHVKARMGPSGGDLDFSCGGVGSLVCSYVRDAANGEMHKQMDKMVGSSTMLGAASSNIDATIQKNLALWGIASLTDIALTPDGSITVTGTPILK